MNVLILTPDRVGSTLLQRVLTIYMLRREFDKPVINLHELTNGLEKYYNTLLNQEVLGKPKGTDWGYYQTLDQVTDLLSGADHYKTSRLAHYHIERRQDSLDSQIKFYEYLNQNFFIISCRRRNLFEHALSWSINGHSKKVNVYHPFEKIMTFHKIYREGITISETTFKNHLTNYKKYINWSDTYFNIQSHFNYEDCVGDLESYILNLDFMKGHSNNTWRDMFDQDYNDWNACHKLIPDVRLFEGNSDPKRIAISNDHLVENWNFNRRDVDLIFPSHHTTHTVPTEIYDYLATHAPKYKSAYDEINELVNGGFLVSGVPIKLQTLMEKKTIVRNYVECIKWYNEWVTQNGMGEKYTENDLDALCLLEISKMNNPLLRLT